jgi:hypothetical protein
MTRRFITVGALLFLAIGLSYGAQRQYVPGTIFDVRHQVRDRIDLYVVNTAIMTEEPCATISVDVDGMRYEGQFLPRSDREMLPSFWKADASILLRLEKHFMYLKREDGSESKFLILAKSRLNSPRNAQ